jgi:misacylated tRNA(Ala) deacylase
MQATTTLFRDDAYLRRCEATVISVDEDGIVLDQTVFYPLGGGQPGDTGRLLLADGSAIDILDTRQGEDGVVCHRPAPGEWTLEGGDKVVAELDWERRYAHMRMHTCLHLLGSVLRFGVTGGNIAATRSRLDFDMEETVDKAAVTEALNALISADHEVGFFWITEPELDARPDLIRTLSVRPPRGVGRIRLLEIPNVDLQPCGGTHVSRTSEIGAVRVAKVEKKGRRNRRVYVSFDPGD